MTQTQNVTALAASGQAVPEVMDRTERLEMLARWFEGRDRKAVTFGAIYNHANMLYPQVEHTDVAELDILSHEDTALGEMASVLRAHGEDVGPTVGDVRKHLELSKDNLHDLVCHCYGHEITGAEMARRLRVVAEMPPASPAMSPAQSERMLCGLDGS